MREVEKAAEKAGLSRMIQSLERGIDTTIGEAGRGLLGGENRELHSPGRFLKKLPLFF